MSKKFIYNDNIPGQFYVHDSCIACDTCTQVCPSCFKLTDDFDHAIIFNQPVTKKDLEECNEAISACPVGAIESYDN